MRTCFLGLMVWILISTISLAHNIEPESELDAYLKTLTSADTPGFSVGVFKDDTVRFKGSYGSQDLTTGLPLNPRTRFELASVTKQFTAVAIAQLRARNLLAYADPVTRFLPELSPLADSVTIRHLLQHTAGLPEYFSLCTNGTQVTNNDVLRYVAGFTTLKNPPGDIHVYNNTGYALLALIIERVSGVSYPTFLDEHVFSVAQMKGTFVNTHPRPVGDNIALAYSPYPLFKPKLEAEITHCNTVYGDGSLFSNLEDMILWQRGLDNNQFISSNDFQEILSPGKTNSGTPFEYGFGWALSPVLGLKAVHHGGSWAGYHNWVVRFQNGYRLIILSNFEQSPLLAISAKIKEVIFKPSASNLIWRQLEQIV